MGSIAAPERSADRLRAVFLVVALLLGLLTVCCAFESAVTAAAAPARATATAAPVVTVMVSPETDHSGCTDDPDANGAIAVREVAVPAAASADLPVADARPPGGAPMARAPGASRASGPPGAAAPRALLCVWRT